MKPTQTMKPTQSIKSLLTLFIAFISITSFAAAATQTLASGKWTKKENRISGTWEIIDDGTDVTLKLKNFKTANAPDLKLFLHEKSISSLSSKNVAKGSKFLAKLKSNKGDQEYKLPKGLKLSEYKSLIIHCQKYTKLWGGANL
jgi:hypothetical protein